MALVIDSETVPASPEFLEKMMPEEIRNPIMPEELDSPEVPDFAEKCPKYASVKDELERAGKRTDWISAAKAKWCSKHSAAVEKWRIGAFEAKAKFVRDAALDARLGHAKLIGCRDTETRELTVFAWEADQGQAAKLREWVRGLKGFYRAEPFSFFGYREERATLEAFFSFFRREMGGGEVSFLPSGVTEKKAPQRCVTYYGNTFDFPFLYRRAWITGLNQRPLFHHGKYFDDSRMRDLDEVWKMGDRGENTGGLDRLAMVLGANPKTGDGATFWKWYAQDPVEGVCYLINDIAQTEEAGRRMGEIQ